jgi:hypothetical protein
MGRDFNNRDYSIVRNCLKLFCLVRIYFNNRDYMVITNKRREKMKIETYLPIFPGFYNTIFEADEGNEIYEINQCRRDKNMPEIDYDDCEWDYPEYNNSISEECTSYVEKELREILNDKNVKVKFQKLISPKEYNFSNDSIDVEISMSKKTLSVVKKYLTDNMEVFSDYIKEKYTSYDGFMSSYSNKVETWLNEYFNDIDGDGHYLGSILNFIFKNEGFGYDDMYEHIDSSYISVINYSELIGEGSSL